jgi:hypothetical protein
MVEVITVLDLVHIKCLSAQKQVYMGCRRF